MFLSACQKYSRCGSDAITQISGNQFGGNSIEFIQPSLSLLTKYSPLNRQCPEKEGFFPDPTDCSKFYQCANYLAWEHQCPGKLYFNKATAQCDFPENVDCQQDSIKQPIKVQDIDPTPGTTFEVIN